VTGEIDEAVPISDDGPDASRARGGPHWLPDRLHGPFDAMVRRIAGVTIWQGLLAAVIGYYTWYFTKVSLDVHNGLGTSSFDLGLYDQGIWLLSRFKAPFVTLMGRNLFGDHASFILVLLVPVYWVFPGAGTLFFFQSLAVAMGAFPIFLYARKRLANEGVALLLSCVYLLHPAVSWINRENFHPDAFLGVFVGMTIYGALERRWRIYTVFLVLTILVKEDVSLVLVPLGVWVALKRDVRRGIATVVASIAASLIAMFVVMKSLIGVPTRNGWRIPFDGPAGFMRTTLEKPGKVIDYFRSESRPFYIWQMTFPFAFVFARLPGVAAIGGLVLFTNVLSNFYYQFHVEYHYSLIVVPALALGSVYALGLLQRRARRWALAAMTVTSLWGALMWGAVPIGNFLQPWSDHPVGRSVGGYWLPSNPSAVAARSLMAEIPANAIVSAHYALTPHLAHRQFIYQFPVPFRVVLYGPNQDLENARARLPIADKVQFVMLQAQLDKDAQADWDAVKAAYHVADSNEFWVLYEHN
jgi:uncharacterized membrane protein